MDSDQSCRNAVANYLATFGLIDENKCSYNTGSYCKARKRLPEKLCKDLLLKSGELAMKNIKPSWKWKGFNVNLVDGTAVTMPDTPANQSKYPQPKSQEAGLGFPIARLVTITSLSTGIVLDYAMSAWRGKQTKRFELAQLYTQRRLIEVDLKFIKEVMKMDILRCKTPLMIRKEISIHLLTYNLIRDVIAQAAAKHDLSPRAISFKGALQLLSSSHSMLILMNDEESGQMRQMELYFGI